MSTEYKSPLPPRKRAKTKEEKEQRKIERILRNRRAAHASREKKRKHVEYLETYVRKLEANIEKMRGNYDRVAGLAGADLVKKASFSDLEDLSELKDKIQLNLTGQLSPDDAEEEESHSKYESNDELGSNSQTETPVKLEEDAEDHISVSNLTLRKRKYEDNQFDMSETSAAEDVSNYYNYLSPISITSPISSPIDLTLKTEDLAPLTLEAAEDVSKGLNQLGQSSEVILSPRFYDSGFSISTY